MWGSYLCQNPVPPECGSWLRTPQLGTTPPSGRLMRGSVILAGGGTGCPRPLCLLPESVPKDPYRNPLILPPITEGPVGDISPGRSSWTLQPTARKHTALSQGARERFMLLCCVRIAEDVLTDRRSCFKSEGTAEICRLLRVNRI